MPFQVRGRDLPGAINVLPEGLGAVLAKRETTKTSTSTMEAASSSTTQSIGGTECPKIQFEASPTKSNPETRGGSPPNSVTVSFLETRMDVKWDISFRRRYSDLVHGDQLFGAEVVDVGVNDVVRRR